MIANALITEPVNTGITFGIILALTPVYAKTALDLGGVSDREAYAFLEGAIGAGNLVGGFVIGLIGSRLGLGRMVIIGYVATGGFVALMALVGNLPLAIGIFVRERYPEEAAEYVDEVATISNISLVLLLVRAVR